LLDAFPLLSQILDDRQVLISRCFRLSIHLRSEMLRKIDEAFLCDVKVDELFFEYFTFMHRVFEQILDEANKSVKIVSFVVILSELVLVLLYLFDKESDIGWIRLENTNVRKTRRVVVHYFRDYGLS